MENCSDFAKQAKQTRREVNGSSNESNLIAVKFDWNVFLYRCMYFIFKNEEISEIFDLWRVLKVLEVIMNHLIKNSLGTTRPTTPSEVFNSCPCSKCLKPSFYSNKLVFDTCTTLVKLL